ncbi:MAG: sigma-70 family RNA polymerase sigma factor [Ruminococcaceae bacterium]|nr:sigma-70 family RNA polymerase sigma factor [Oscillospiraceae bacterium]
MKNMSQNAFLNCIYIQKRKTIFDKCNIHSIYIDFLMLLRYNLTETFNTCQTEGTMLLFLLLLEESERKPVEFLYNKYCRYMYQTAYNILGNNIAAEDAVHNAFVAIINNLDGIKYGLEKELEDPDSDYLLGYVCRAAKNCALNIKAKKDKISRRETSYPEDDTLLGDIEMCDKIIADESVMRIKNCIKKLPEIYRDIFVMHFIGEMSYKEIGKLLSLPQATIRKRIERGKVKLAEELKKEGFDIK